MIPRIYGLLIVLSLIAGAQLRADHNSPVGSVALLMAYTDDLERAVRYSSLNYNIQSSVYRFASDVDRLAECVRYGGPFDDHTENPGVPQQCRYQLDYARSSFSVVSRYLWDTNYEYPQVYHAWEHSRGALNALYVIGGGGGGQISCVAVDNGWEEHYGGHVGYGRSRYEAERQALNECQRRHGRCRIQSCTGY